MNEDCIGRVVIPLRHMCTDDILPKPRPLFRARYRVTPASKQGSQVLQARRCAMSPRQGPATIQPKSIRPGEREPLVCGLGFGAQSCRRDMRRQSRVCLERGWSSRA